MPETFVAIVGSADPERSDGYNPPLKHIDLIPQAAEELGNALAEAGFGIMVYAPGSQFIESDVVRGYVESGRAQPGSIQVRYPLGAPGTEAKFHKEDVAPELFDRRADRHEYWQVSFYMSLQDAGGIMLVGGAESAFITGLVAQMNRIPCLALATFGGSAESVWRVALGELATQRHRTDMAAAWTPGSAKHLVGVLQEQCRARKAEEERRRLEQEMTSRKMRQRAILAATGFLAAAVFTGIGMFGSPPRWLFAVAFFGAPVFAGLSGGLARLVSDDYRGEAPHSEQATAQGMVLGMIAGVIAAVLFVLAQVVSNPDLLGSAGAVPAGLGRLIPFELIVGFTAGFTLEAVFAKLRRSDVLDLSAVAVKDQGDEGGVG